MKNKLLISTILIFSLLLYIENTYAQTPATTGDLAALPTVNNPSNCTLSGTLFPQPSSNYSTTPSGVQLGVNNTGTDICQQNGTSAIFQAMVWDEVVSMTSQTNFTSRIYLSWNYNNLGTVLNGSITFAPAFGETGGYDPDVAIFSNNDGTFIQVVFENNTTRKIDGYTYRWNGTTFVLYNPLKSTFLNDSTKKAKNPNICVPKTGYGLAVVWHEEGLVTPAQTLTVTYSTVPQTSFTTSVSILQSKVYIYCFDRSADPTGGVFVLGSPLSGVLNLSGKEVIPSPQASTTNHLFKRNFNPDVTFNEISYNQPSNPTLRGISVAFLSQWFDPATFTIQTGLLSVVQGNYPQFSNTNSTSVLTSTYYFTTNYNGKPRIAARLPFTGSNTANDFSVVMGNVTLTPGVCGGASSYASKLHNWWVQDGVASQSIGYDLISGTSYANSRAIDPVISCINGKGHYNVTFSAMNSLSNGMDIMANTYKQGVPLNTVFSYVNKGVCSTSTSGEQVVPSVASIKTSTSSNTDNAITNYLFWDQANRSLDYKKSTNNTAPGGVALRETQIQNTTKFIAYPNPSDNEISFDYNLDENQVASEIEVFNMNGQSINKYKVEQNSNSQKIEIGKLPTGTYIAILKTNTQEYKLEFLKK